MQKRRRVSFMVPFLMLDHCTNGGRHLKMYERFEPKEPICIIPNMAGINTEALVLVVSLDRSGEKRLERDFTLFKAPKSVVTIQPPDPICLYNPGSTISLECFTVSLPK